MQFFDTRYELESATGHLTGDYRYCSVSESQIFKLIDRNIIICLEHAIPDDVVKSGARWVSNVSDIIDANKNQIKDQNGKESVPAAYVIKPDIGHTPPPTPPPTLLQTYLEVLSHLIHLTHYGQEWSQRIDYDSLQVYITTTSEAPHFAFGLKVILARIMDGRGVIVNPKAILTPDTIHNAMHQLFGIAYIPKMQDNTQDMRADDLKI